MDGDAEILGVTHRGATAAEKEPTGVARLDRCMQDVTRTLEFTGDTEAGHTAVAVLDQGGRRLIRTLSSELSLQIVTGARS